MSERTSALGGRVCQRRWCVRERDLFDEDLLARAQKAVAEKVWERVQVEGGGEIPIHDRTPEIEEGLA